MQTRIQVSVSRNRANEELNNELVIQAGPEERFNNIKWNGLTADELKLEENKGIELADWIAHNLPTGILYPCIGHLKNKYGVK